MKTNGNVNEKLRSPEVLTEIGGCIASGMNWSALARHLKAKFEVETSIPTLKKVFSTYQERRGEVIGASRALKADIKDEIEKTVIDSKGALARIHKFVDVLMDKASGKDDRLALDCAREILNQLYYQEKILNRMQSGIHVENMNKLEITQIVVTKLDELEKMGKIKIIDTTLKDGG